MTRLCVWSHVGISMHTPAVVFGPSGRDVLRDREWSPVCLLDAVSCRVRLY
jgi:hypothetical protein